MSDVELASESFAQIWPEVDDMFREHFGEVDGGIEPRRPYRLDAGLMEAMWRSGSLRITTARREGKLVGYCTWNVMPDVESAGLLIAQQGAWFVAPDAGFRTGYKLFIKSLAELRRLGVKCVFPHHRMQGRGDRLGRFFKRIGAVEIQHTYCLWIGGANA